MMSRQVRLLHLSDIHCGRPYVEQHVEAAFAVAKSMPIDAIVVSGDLTQRARKHEFLQARAILGRLEKIAPTLVIPGNHDAQWWNAPFGIGNRANVHERWRTFVQQETDPTLTVPGATIVGLNSAPGIMPWTLTLNPRDLRVKGGLTRDQLENARERMSATPAGDLRVLVVHHNVLRGNLSNRWGMARPERTLDAIAAMQPHVVCTGHDHEERLETVSRNGTQFLVATANTLSSRMRGRRASSFNVIEWDGQGIRATAWLFDESSKHFHAGDFEHILLG
jgi:3',5'-cyclic AMP phosphodiesterase CpdA